MLVLYLGVAIYTLLFARDRRLFPPITLDAATTETTAFHVADTAENTLLVRRYNAGQTGCVVFFPGQDGAHGETQLGILQALIAQAMHTIQQTCPKEKTVLVGVH
ncbi:hypothetical protein HMY34_05925 [Thiothrix subterranea]|uniref:hypothetical protein n=1 Tax=Thiothrix subterranea TaxID=2735563 RepID=UPI00192B867E|nr:hypothetical protein [Thiothrix subterranea]QQZ28327.1 hypothetical protein HMY34_05925 [Thiothrix subterranea]